jgi:hypothetical protein
LRLASRGDAGIRSFAWSPRVPEYLILRGGGRQARIRLHRLMQPDELLAWIEFYDQVRRSASATRSRPTTGPIAGATTGPATVPRTRASAGAASGPLSAQTLTPDMSGASGPLDPWGSGRQGEPVTSRPTTHTLKTPFVARAPTTPRLPEMPDIAARWQADEPGDGAPPDLPSSHTPAARHDDAWLRETGAGARVGSGEPEAPMTGPEPEPWTDQRERDGWRAEPIPQPTSAAPYEPQMADHWAASQRWGADLASSDDERYDERYDERNDALYQAEEETPTSEVETAAPPWRDDGWQPPILPRFGPPSGGRPSGRDEPPDRR